MFSIISDVLHSSKLVCRKLISVNNIIKHEFCGTLYLCSEISDKPPKKPPSSYLQFLHNTLPELTTQFPSCSYREKNTMARNLWRSLDNDEKKKFSQSFYEDFEKYKMACIQYECQMRDNPKIEEESPTMMKKQKRKLKKLRKLSGRPKKPPSSFLLFLKTKRGHLPKTPIVNWIYGVLEEYKNLNDDEKAKYEAEAKKLNEEYKKGICEWENSLIKEGKFDILYKRSKFKKSID